MSESEGRLIIRALHKKWTVQILLAHLLLTFTLTLLFAAIVMQVFNTGWFAIPVILIVVSTSVFQFLHHKLSEHDIAGYLNRALPELQESAGLLLKDEGDVNVLEKLQIRKIEGALKKNIRQPKTVERKWRTSIMLLFVALLTCVAMFVVPPNWKWKSPVTSGSPVNTVSVNQKTKLPQVDKVNVTITPPAYTRKGRREQDGFNVTAEDGAYLHWKISTTIGVKDVQLIFNDKSVLPLQPADTKGTTWSTRKQVKNSGFYQVRIDETLSDLYKIELIKDELPAIVVHSPKPTTLIEAGKQQRTLVQIAVSDDYGIRNTWITATMASGSGEAVTFKEQQWVFGNVNSGNKNYRLQKQIDLAAIGMKPGDELYFYVSTTDTYNQEKRSDIYVVRLEDTALLMSMEGLVSGVDLRPEFFRSQRQVIIDTEQLLRDKDTISVDKFAARSNELGIDQKLLRLRYGKFLGEETDVDIGNDHDHEEEELTDGNDFGNARKMMEEVSHNHDNAEDATFFDAQTKKQLRATLTEMWKAELQLRIIQPKDALPFEYKALKLLKELQQSTRAFVSKTGIRTTPLDPGKRLTGELDKIGQPVKQQHFQQKSDGTELLRKALGLLEQIRSKEALQQASIEILDQASVQFSKKAAADPSAYLSSFEAFQRILMKQHSPDDISIAGSALQRMISASSALPKKSNTNADHTLSHRYFMHLIKAND